MIFWKIQNHISASEKVIFKKGRKDLGAQQVLLKIIHGKPSIKQKTLDN